MMMPQTPDRATDMALFQVALKRARENWKLDKAEIAERAGMNPRMLHRLASGSTRAAVGQRERILKACNLPVTASCLLAASQQTELIGTSSSDWLDRFISAAIANLGRIREESGCEVEGRWAAGDAALIYSRWQSVIERQRDRLADTFLEEWQDLQNRRR